MSRRRFGGGWPTSTKPRSTPSCPKRPRLTDTIQTWWPAVLTALLNDVDNARTEGSNRIIKQVKRVGWVPDAAAMLTTQCVTFCATVWSPQTG